jgi:hypothetical protein
MKVKTKEIPSEHELETFRQEGIDNGNIYDVHGVVSFDGALSYLIQAKIDIPPVWIPAGYFFICDHTIDGNWKVGSWPDKGIDIILSYEEMSFNFEHYEGLIERDSDALSLFMVRTGGDYR